MNEAAVLTAVEAFGRVDIASADEATCRELLSHSRHGRGFFDAADAQLLSRLGELHGDQGGAPPADIATTCGGVSAAEGKRRERRSKTIDAVPSFGEALGEGRVSAEHVDALANATAKLDDAVRTAVFDRSDDLLSDATRLSPERFGRSVRDLARRLEHDAGLERNRRQRRDTFLSRKLNPATGMIEGRFALHPELGNQMFSAIDREVTATIRAGERQGDTEFVERRYDRNRLAAEALGTLVAGGHQQARPLEADVTVIVDEQTASTGTLHDRSVCETSDGAAVPPASIRRLLCQGRVTPIILGADGTALDAGRTIRHANRHQRRALRAMYRCCAFGDCDIAFDRCEIHHILPWEIGGATDLRNLVPLCSRHHHTVHDGGWQLDLATDRTLTIRRSDGTVFARCSPDIADERARSRQRRHRRAAA